MNSYYNMATLNGLYRDLRKEVRRLEARVAELEKKLSGYKDLDEESFVAKHGELISKKKAAEILGKCRQTVGRMIWDGRLKGNEDGSMVSVRSVYKYLYGNKEEV